MSLVFRNISDIWNHFRTNLLPHCLLRYFLLKLESKTADTKWLIFGKSESLLYFPGWILTQTFYSGLKIKSVGLTSICNSRIKIKAMHFAMKRVMSVQCCGLFYIQSIYGDKSMADLAKTSSVLWPIGANKFKTFQFFIFNLLFIF